MTRVKHWQDVSSFVLGAWLALSPWALGYRGDPNAMGGAVIAGLALMAVALGAMFAPRAWEEWPWRSSGSSPSHRRGCSASTTSRPSCAMRC